MKESSVLLRIEAYFCSRIDSVVAVDDHPGQTSATLYAHGVHDDAIFELHALVQKDLATEDGISY